MEKRTGPSGNGKKRIDKIIISAELDAEINAFIKENQQAGNFTKEMDAVLLKMKGAGLPYRKIAEFISQKFNKKIYHAQCSNRIHHLQDYRHVQPQI